MYPGLGALHTIFLRYHNYVAGELADRHKSWDNDQLFYTARKIVIAVLQHIIYNGIVGTQFLLYLGVFVVFSATQRLL